MPGKQRTTPQGVGFLLSRRFGLCRMEHAAIIPYQSRRHKAISVCAGADSRRRGCKDTISVVSFACRASAEQIQKEGEPIVRML